MRPRPFVPIVALGALVALTAAGAAWSGFWLVGTAADPVAATRLTTDVSLEPDSDLLNGVVPVRTTLARLLGQLGIEASDATALVGAVGGVIDLRRMRAGQAYVIDRLYDGRVRRFEYEIDADRRLVAARAPLDAPAAFQARVELIPKVTEVVSVDGAITRAVSSLTAAVDEAGEGIQLALGLADVFSGEIDFNSDLQPGDRFRVVVERRTREGRPAGYGAILAAEFVNDGRTLQAFRFAPDGGVPGYYDAEGRSLKRFFLKSPLKFEPRVTSRFSRSRLHPILGYARAHNGVDYRAPAGAPIVSVAPGVVTTAGWTAGGGRTVRVRHPNGYESEYLHMSSVAVRPGERVAQGTVVGRVGATGLATAPHLHYGLRKSGRYVNPIAEHRNMPPGEPVPAALRALFVLERDRVMGLLVPNTRVANN
jgi:murein DD-endopeptidase MepM/ murein hydrolase activator NlpD